MAEPAPKVRADELLVQRGLAASRTLAQALILAGKVRTGPDSVVAKASQRLAADSPLLVEQPPRFVSRGGEKLEGALARFGLDPSGLAALDVGASTGGFTDCLLQGGATEVTCVDVGQAQLHAKLRGDPRVTNLERLNARELPLVRLPRETYGVVVMDLSFISLTTVLPSVWPRLAPGGWLVALVKPQFEATRQEADKARGVIKDPAIHARVLESVTRAAASLPGAEVLGSMDSPLLGGEGNREFLLALRRRA
jgi:23S rRNA (cytidine1920-2'-O)/16S rRNA (cytidine1409-2'-O)-methyltransferase